MHFFSLLPALLMFAGVNAGVLEDHGYTLHKSDDGTCTITTDYYKEGNQPVNEFTVKKDSRIIVIRQALNDLETKHRDQMSLAEILEAVCSEYDLVPDSINSVVMDAYKNDDLTDALEYYRELYSVADNQYVTTYVKIPVILEGRNWKELESNFLMQNQNEELQYLLAENPIEGVEREKKDSTNKKQKDEELAKRTLEISLNETFPSLVRDEETLNKAYKNLKKACPIDTTDEAFYEMGRILRSPLVKGMTILQSWMNFETIFERHHKADKIPESVILKTFLILLPLEYQEVAKECYRKENISTDEVIQRLEAVKKTNGINGQAKYNKSKSKCFNCGKEGHLKTECWSKKKTSTKQKANQATEEKPSRNETDG
ncbi:Zinc knuckle [Ceratocystis platani]|uniref:Zinc knuckle n=1 Tax=Ceratocystis fimbriata f. sp. platani TaxID=88771 RepID=A0A0F8CR95_CERFI|nr:Zinc knuckle [Ceratocystis platani]